MTDVFLQNDGSVMMVGEQQYLTDNGQNMKYYRRDDMLFVRLEADGTLAWMKRMSKRQTYELFYKYQAKSYTHLSTNGSHYFLMLDRFKNLTLESGRGAELLNTRADGFFMAWQVNEKTGEIKKHSIFDMHKLDGHYELNNFSIANMVITTPTTVVYETQPMKKKQLFVKIELSK